MKSRRIVSCLVILIVLASMAVAGCAKKQTHANTLTAAINVEPRTLNTILDPGAEGHMVETQIYEGLMGLDSTGQIVPVLATSYEQLQPGVFEFTIRQGVKFQDGSDFTADDVVYTFNRVLNKDSGSVQYAMYGGYIDKVEKTAADKVQITLKKPWPDFLTILATKPYTFIASPRAIEQYGQDFGVTAAVGTGPFKLAEWAKGQYVKLVKNPDYWDKQYPKLDEVTFKVIPESGAQLIALKTGDVDMLFDAPYKDLAELEKDSAYRVDRYGSGASQDLCFNTTKAPFDDKGVRQAISLGINRQQIVDSLFYGYAEVATSVFPSWHWAFDADIQSPYDPDQAKSLLAEAGYNEQNPLKFTILTVAVPQYHDQAILIQSDLAKIGVQAEIQDLETGAMWDAVDAGTNDAYMYRLIWDAPSIDYTWRPFGGESVLNDPRYNKPGGFQNPDAEAVLKQALVEYDQAKAKPLFNQFDQYIAEDVPKARIAWADNINVLHSYIKGYTTWMMDIVPLKTTYISEE